MDKIAAVADDSAVIHQERKPRELATLYAVMRARSPGSTGVPRCVQVQPQAVEGKKARTSFVTELKETQEEEREREREGGGRRKRNSIPGRSSPCRASLDVAPSPQRGSTQILPLPQIPRGRSNKGDGIPREIKHLAAPFSEHVVSHKRDAQQGRTTLLPRLLTAVEDNFSPLRCCR